MPGRFFVKAAVRYTINNMRQLFSYKSKLLYSRKMPRRSYKTFFWVALVFLFASGGAYGSYRLAAFSYWQITHISVSGTKSLQENEVRNAVADYFSGALFRVIPKTNYFFVRTSLLEKVLLEKFPRIRSVQVQKKFPSSLVVVFDERDIWALYCNDSLYAKEKNAAVVLVMASSTPPVAPDASKESARFCFYIDNTGVIIDSAIEYRGFLLPIFFERRTGNLALGERVLSDADILFFNSVSEEYKKNISVNIISFEKIDSLPDDYILFFQEGWYALVPRSANISLSAKNMKTLLESVIKNDRNRLLYIDARFRNKMFYKLKVTVTGK